MTTPDGANQLREQTPLSWKKATNSSDGIRVDGSKAFQTMEGFGHALTGGSAQLMMKMSPGARKALVQELFGHGSHDIGTSYLRVSVGSSDMNDHVYTYDDVPAGETDTQLAHFTLSEDEKDVIPVLREILAVQPAIKIMATPWTAPAWMKTNDAAKGGSLKPEFYELYAQYLVLYLKAMQAHGIRIDALSPQNEPENPKNTPSMVMSAEEEATFIGKHLGPDIATAGLHTKIIDFDHNCDHPEYSEAVLRDAAAARYTDGSGFHLYLGDISALTTVHDAFPSKNIYFTEQMVVPQRRKANEDATSINPNSAIAQPVARLIIGAPNHWSRNVLLWNLAADAQNGPHTNDGGCPVCTGALTLEGDHVTRLTAYYTAAHASKFVPAGSLRIASDADPGSLPHVAFRTPDKKYVLIVSNISDAERRVKILCGQKQADAVLPAGAVATYVW